MKQESLRTIVTGCTLAVALTLAGATPAHAASGPGSSLWSWLDGLWNARITIPWIGTGQAQGGHGHPGTAKGWEKAGSCVDPNGANGCAVSGTTDSVPGVNDSGNAIRSSLRPQG